jgi:DNA-binding LacI/PurR family transcriptional regulator
VLADVDALATNEKVFRQVISSGALDGLLLQRAGTVSDVFVARVASERLAMVLMNESATGAEASVATDDFAAAHLATTHLAELGHTRIGLLRLSGDHVRSSVRMAGWSAALNDAGIPTDRNLIREGGQTIVNGYAGMTELLSSAPDVSAVLVSNVVAAVGALRACTDRGVAVPDDLSIIAVHDAEIAEYTVPRLSTVRLPLAEMGRQSVALLLEQLDKQPARHVTITEPAPQLILRESSIGPRVAAPPGP